LKETKYNSVEQDLAHIRSIMERSTKFLSLSGWAGIMAGVYAILGVIHVHVNVGFRLNPDETVTGAELLNDPIMRDTTITALLVLFLALFTAIFLSWKQALKKGEVIWNNSTKRLVYSMAVPLLTGGLFILALLSDGMITWIPVVMLIFYGLALFNASVYTIEELKYFGFYQIFVGLLCAFNPSFGIWFWSAGFGLGHIVYGTYMHIRYER
jgi:hypothetical protein